MFTPTLRKYFSNLAVSRFEKADADYLQKRYRQHRISRQEIEGKSVLVDIDCTDLSLPVAGSPAMRELVSFSVPNGVMQWTPPTLLRAIAHGVATGSPTLHGSVAGSLHINSTIDGLFSLEVLLASDVQGTLKAMSSLNQTGSAPTLFNDALTADPYTNGLDIVFQADGSGGAVVINMIFVEMLRREF